MEEQVHILDIEVMDAFDKFSERPSDETFENLRECFIQSSGYDPYGSKLDDIYPFIEEEKFDIALAELMSRMGSWFMNPGCHILASFLFHAVGEEESSKMEMFISRMMLEGILRSGDGTKEHPYKITRVDDEYDVLEHFKQKLDSQALIKEDSRSFDKLTTADGAVHWFDITEVLATIDGTGSSFEDDSPIVN